MTSLAKTQRIATNPSLPAPDDPGEEEVAPGSFRLVDSVVSFFVSVVFHSLVLFFLALFIHSHSPEEEPQEILTAELDTVPEEKSITIQDDDIQTLMSASDETDSSKLQADVRQLANASEPPPVSVPVVTDRGRLPADVSGSGNGWGGNALAGLGEGAGSGRVAGSGQGEKGDGEVGFFGTKAKGNSFVFIVDCSGSMTTRTGQVHPRLQIPLTRFIRARQELYLSLSQLRRGQTFYIIFYNNETFPMFYPRNAQSLVPASPDNLGWARRWIQKVKAGGGTEPQEAMRLALALRPQVIFFLTDGAIPGATRRIAKENNKSRTRIHTIGFGNKNNLEILRNIAKDNQGRFRFVP